MEKSVLSLGLLSEQIPDVIFNYNNGKGSFLYNHNIREVKVIKDDYGSIQITTDEKKATGTMFQYDSVRCEYPRTADNIFATLLTAKYPARSESKLLNEYQSACLGLLPETAKEPYEVFLAERIAIRASVDADCLSNNIPTDL